MAGVNIFEIPLRSTPTQFSVKLSGVLYVLVMTWKAAVNGGWFMDILDVNDNPIVRGIPLVTGADLLAQYGYLKFGGQLFIQSDSDPDAVPSFTNLGITSHLYWHPNS